MENRPVRVERIPRARRLEAPCREVFFFLLRADKSDNYCNTSLDDKHATRVKLGDRPGDRDIHDDGVVIGAAQKGPNPIPRSGGLRGTRYSAGLWRDGRASRTTTRNITPTLSSYDTLRRLLSAGVACFVSAEDGELLPAQTDRWWPAATAAESDSRRGGAARRPVRYAPYVDARARRLSASAVSYLRCGMSDGSVPVDGLRDGYIRG
jgi:hypothetical protein